MPSVGIVAAACRVKQWKLGDRQATFAADGLEGSHGIVCLKLPSAPESVTIDDQALAKGAFDYADGLVRVRFTNKATPQHIAIHW